MVSPVRFVGSRVYACLGVTCHPHFWQNDRGLLRATAIARGVTDTEQESTQRVNSGEENSPAAPPQWGAADAEIKVPSGENTELKRSLFQARK